MSSHLNLAQVAFNLISTLGYGGLAAGLFIDSAGIPIPSEVLIPLATVLAISGRFNLVAIFIVGVLAQTLGGLATYLIGRYAGEPFLLRYGKYVLISAKDIKRTHAAFGRYGRILTLVGRCIPVIRGLIGYPAGIAEMPVIAFIVFSAIGSAIWTGILMILGSLLKRHIELINKYSEQLSYIVIVVVIAAIAWHIYHVMQDRKHA